MNPRRIYLVEFLYAKRRRASRVRERLRNFRRGQPDLPGLPDYGLHDKPEIQTVIHTEETLTSEERTAEPSVSPRLRVFPLRVLPCAPLVGLPVWLLLGWPPHLWLWYTLLLCASAPLRLCVEKESAIRNPQSAIA